MKKDYKSANPQYVIPEQYQGWPEVLPITGATAEEAMPMAMEMLIAEDTTASVTRRLDDEEIQMYREEYTSLMESDRVECQARLRELTAAEASIKAKIKSEQETMSSIMQRINDNVRTINDGTVDEELLREKSLRVAVDGHYLYYTYVDGMGFKLARVQPIDQHDDSLFARQTKNQEEFIKLLGMEFTPRKSFAALHVADAIAALEDFPDKEYRLAATVTSRDGMTIGARDALLDMDMLHAMVEEGIAAVIIYASSDATPDA